MIMAAAKAAVDGRGVEVQRDIRQNADTMYPCRIPFVRVVGEDNKRLSTPGCLGTIHRLPQCHHDIKQFLFRAVWNKTIPIPIKDSFCVKFMASFSLTGCKGSGCKFFYEAVWRTFPSLETLRGIWRISLPLETNDGLPCGDDG